MKYSWTATLAICAYICLFEDVTVIHLPDEDRYLSKTVNRGTSVTIQCDIQGEPNPVWRRHGQNLNVRISSGIQV